jgi:hypothetical protein
MSAGPHVATAWQLTGNIRFRAAWFRKVVLRVEEERLVGIASPFRDPETRQTRWRDADIDDLLGVRVARLAHENAADGPVFTNSDDLEQYLLGALGEQAKSLDEAIGAIRKVGLKRINEVLSEPRKAVEELTTPPRKDP